MLRGYLLDRVDQQLADSLRPAAEALVRGQAPGATAGERQDRLVGAGDFYRRAVRRLGRAAALDRAGCRSASRRSRTCPTLDSEAAAELAGEPFTTGSDEGRERWRVLVAPLGGGLSVAVAQSLEGIDETVGRLILIELVVGAIALAVLAAAAWWTVRRSLRPLVEVERTADAIARGDLSQRVPESDPAHRGRAACRRRSTRCSARSRSRSERRRSPRPRRARPRSGCAASSPTPATSCVRR